MLNRQSIQYINETAQRHGAQRVLLFGSCLNKPELEARDIDLAVEGLDDVSFNLMWDDLMWAPELNKKMIDLVRVEDNLPILVKVRSDGVEIYDRSSPVADFHTALPPSRFARHLPL